MLQDDIIIGHSFAHLIPLTSVMGAPTSLTVKNNSSPALYRDAPATSLKMLQAAEPESQVIFAEMVAVPAGVTVDLDMGVPQASRLGVTLIVPPQVGVALLDPSDIQVDALPAGDPDNFEPMASLGVENPAAGEWTLRLTNQGSEAVEIPVSAWVEGGSIALSLHVSQIDPAGRVGVQATLTDDDVPVRGAVMTVHVLGFGGSALMAALLDDGLHGDGQANDGVYGVNTDLLASDDYTIAVAAQVGGANWFAANAVHVEAADPADSAPIRNVFTALPITLSWSGVTWAYQYEIQVDQQSDFDLPLDYTAVVSASNLALDIATLDEGDYSWRVRARPVDGDWGEWSVVDSFRLDTP